VGGTVAVNYTDVKICNLALAEIGEAPISSLTDDTKKARQLNTMYALKRDELLRMHPWGHSRKRVVLAKTNNTPLFDFAYEFLIPSDCLKILKIDCDYRFSREGDKILTDSSEVRLFYVFRNEDPNSYDSEFVTMFAKYLAYSLAWSLKGTRTLREDLKNEFELSLRLARHSSAVESSPLYDMEYEGEGTLIAARSGAIRPDRY
jgi:hypothetical protein